MNDIPGLRPQEAVGNALRDFARHILAEGRVAIEDGKRVEAVAVHDFRAAMKSWRAFLRLIEPHLPEGERRWRIEARDLARMLAGARDAQAALDAVADCEKHTPSHRLSSQSWGTIRTKLEDLRVTAETASLTPTLRKRISAALDRAEAQIERWPLDELTFSDVTQALREDYRRARRLMPEKWREASAQELHDLRQRVVVHRYQIELVEPLWPRLGRTWVREAQKLRNRLGKCQDLAVLAGYCEPHQPLARWRSRLLSVISQRQAQHVKAAPRIAGRLYAEKPKAFRRRLEALWDGMSASR
ncbi:MAG: CHAD domain-containing protein [Hyphomicrobiales bacterium]